MTIETIDDIFGYDTLARLIQQVLAFVLHVAHGQRQE